MELCISGFMKGIQLNMTFLLSPKLNKIVYHTLTVQFLHWDLMAWLDLLILWDPRFVKNPPANAGGARDPLGKEMATHCSILAWEIPWTEELGGLQSMGSQGAQTEHTWVFPAFELRVWTPSTISPLNTHRARWQGTQSSQWGAQFYSHHI